MIKARIAEIDATLSRQLNPILHHGEFQRLEAHLARPALPGPSERDGPIAQDPHLERWPAATAVGQEPVPGVRLERGLPAHPAIGGGIIPKRPVRAAGRRLRIRPGRADIALLEWISHIAAAAHAPFLAAAGPAMFGLEHITELADVHHLASRFDDPAYAAWHRFRDSEDSRYVGLCVPRILLRRPYGPDGELVETFSFIEEVSVVDRSGYLWGNAAFAWRRG